MIYRLYMYSTIAVTASALAVSEINHALRTDSYGYWKEHDPARSMDHFDADSVKTQIETELGDKCIVSVRYPPYAFEQKEYLYISTSYVRAREILPGIHKIAATNRLALYDAETDRVFFKDLIDDAFIDLRIRERELRDLILKYAAPVRRIRKIYDYRDERDRESYYSVTLSKDFRKTFTERVTEFYECLKSSLAENEELYSRDRSFTVNGGSYDITYVLEGYKKHANMVGYYEYGRARQSLTRRMSIEEAYKWMEGCSEEEKADIFVRMNFIEMKSRFPNPADRLVNSVRITKWLRKQKLEVKYSGIEYHRAEIIFHVVPSDFYQDAKEISSLKIEEDTASFILPFIYDFYPYLQDRYYWKNHVPLEMWKDIVNRIKEAKEWVLYDTYDPAYKKYIERFLLYAFGDCYDVDPADFVYAHRFEIAKLYEIFILWSEEQTEQYWITGENRMINIQGP